MPSRDYYFNGGNYQRVSIPCVDLFCATKTNLFLIPVLSKTPIHESSRCATIRIRLWQSLLHFFLIKPAFCKVYKRTEQLCKYQASPGLANSRRRLWENKIVFYSLDSLSFWRTASHFQCRGFVCIFLWTHDAQQVRICCHSLPPSPKITWNLERLFSSCFPLPTLRAKTLILQKHCFCKYTESCCKQSQIIYLFPRWKYCFSTFYFPQLCLANKEYLQPNIKPIFLTRMEGNTEGRQSSFETLLSRGCKGRWKHQWEEFSSHFSVFGYALYRI